jgi:hypothetical protein
MQKYVDFYNDLLTALSDGKPHTVSTRYAMERKAIAELTRNGSCNGIYRIVSYTANDVQLQHGSSADVATMHRCAFDYPHVYEDIGSEHRAWRAANVK